MSCSCSGWSLGEGGEQAGPGRLATQHPRHWNPNTLSCHFIQRTFWKQWNTEVWNFPFEIQKSCISSFTWRCHFIPNGYDLMMSPLHRVAMLCFFIIRKQKVWTPTILISASPSCKLSRQHPDTIKYWLFKTFMQIACIITHDILSH